MSALEIGNKLVALCQEGKNLEAIESLYAKDVVSAEAMEGPGMPRVMNGLEAVIGKAKWWTENTEVHSSEVTGPLPHGDDKFAVLFKIDATMKPSGQRNVLNEVAVYTVKGGKIVREEFFYKM